MQRKWKRRWQRLTKAILPPVAAGLLFVSAYSPAFANPVGGTVVSGSAAIANNGSTTTINQSTNKAIINWQSFSIGKGETVNFVQPGSTSVALNRVIGNDVSSIYGTLNANGKVYLINPNGILFAPGSSVNVGGLVASTLQIADSDFLSGKYTLQKDGSAGNVTNQGHITAMSEAVLIGPKVANEGIIAAKVTGLAAGNTVSLDFTGDNLLNVTVDTGAAGGSATNTGTITATGGLVVMSAGTKDALLHTVVNNSGVIRAQSVNHINGIIRLEGGTVTNAGTVDASGKTSGAVGGTVKVLGDTVTLASSSTIDVSGDAGGGTTLVGGAYQGGASEYAATYTTVQNGAAINADAITSGNGGSVVVWANDTTNLAGMITAKGGQTGGNGGSVETSGKKTLKVADTVRVTTTAANGKTGNWLLDPNDFTIANSGGDMSVTTLQSALDTSDVTITTTSGAATVTGVSGASAGTAGKGDINVNDAVSWGSAHTLTLSAYHNININAPITATSGGLTLGAVGAITAPAAVKVQTFTLTKGTWSQNASSLPDFYAKDFRISGGTFLRAKGGDGTSVSPYQIADIYGLQGIGSAGMLGKYYKLANNIDAGDTQHWNSGAGFVPIGYGGRTFNGSFDGGSYTISGLTINQPSTYNVGLFGYSSGTISNVGLIGGSITGGGTVGGLAGANEGTITNSYSTGMVNVGTNGGTNVGGLVGANYAGGTITSSYSTGMVSGSTNVGGLVGLNYAGGTITSSYSTGAVTGDRDVGGLSGFNRGTITSSYSTGTATGNEYVGGLVGLSSSGSSIENSYSMGAVTSNSCGGGLVGSNGGTITNGYSMGEVSGSTNVGGLAGENTGTIANSYSTGVVSSNGIYDCTGGLVGQNISIITNSYSTGTVTGNQLVGGMVGLNSGSITNSYSTGVVSSSGSNGRSGGLVGQNAGTITNSYSTGTVTGSNYVGGLVGYNSGTVTNSYWDVDTSGKTTGIYAGNTTGATGLYSKTASLAEDSSRKSAFTQGSYTGFDFTNTWYMIDGQTRPFLQSEYSTTITNAHQLQLMALNLGASYTLGKNIDMSELTKASGLWRTATTATSAGSNGNYGFVPIGSYSTKFTGSFDGGGHTITGLTINRPGSLNIGLFGYFAGATISNVGLIGGSVTGSSAVGGLAGVNSGTIESSYSTGRVTGGGNAIGGLVGYNYYGTVKTSYSTGEVKGGSNSSYIGGLVGCNYSGTIEASYSMGEVSGGDGSNYIGGLVGDNYSGTIETSYSTGAVTGGDGSYGIGGLVGYNDSGSITNSYSMGEVSGGDGSNYIGGLVGYNYSGTIETSYSTGAVTSGDGSSYVGGLAGSNDSGTIETSYSTGEVSGGDGSNYIGGLVGDNDSSSITNSYSTSEVKGGSNSNSIGGLVGRSFGSSSITTSYSTGEVKGGSNSNFIGGLVGYNDSGTVTASYSTGAVTGGDGSYGIGGLVGYNDSGTIETSYSTGAVTGGSGSALIGGLVGENYYGTIETSYSTGKVTGGDGSYGIGGLVGENCYGTIETSYSTSAVTGGSSSSDIGGLVGYNDNGGSIENSYSTGEVTGGDGSHGIGGLVGDNYGGSIENSYSTGKVTGGDGSYGIGGLVGRSFGSSSITNSYSTGAVTGGSSSSDIGGLVGYNTGTITASYYATTNETGAAINTGSGYGSYGTGKTLVELTDPATFSGWDISAAGGSRAVWRIYDGYTTPLLRSFLTPLTVTVSSATGTTYNGSAQTVTAGYSTSIDNTLLKGNLTYTDQTTNTAGEAKNAGTYTVSGSGLYSSQQGYDISYNSGTLIIAPKALTAAQTAAVTKTYDGTTAASFDNNNLTLSGVVGDDIVSVGGSGAYAGKNAGANSVMVTGVTLSNSNYTLATADINGGAALTGQINPKALTAAQATAVTKTYDGTTAASFDNNNLTLSGVVGDDAVSVSVSGAYAGKNAGASAVTVTGVTLSNSNYTLATADINGGAALTGQINPKALTAAQTAAVTKTYDGTTAASFDNNNLTLSGVVGDDIVSVGGSGAYAGKNAGANSVTVTGVTLSNSNYTLAAADINGGTLTGQIDKAALLIKAANQSKTYGKSLELGTTAFNVSGLVTGDSVNSVVLTSSGADAAAKAGKYAITASGGSGSGLGNYNITYADGVLTVQSLTNPAYNGAVGYTGQLAAGLIGPLGRYGQPHGLSETSGYQAGAAGGVMSLTVVGTGINTGGYVLPGDTEQ